MCMADSEAWLIRGTRVVLFLNYILNGFHPQNPTSFPHSSHPDLACLCLYCTQTSSWFLKSRSRLLLLSIRSCYRQQSVSGSFFLSSSCLGFLLSLSCFGFLLLSSRLGFLLSSISWLLVTVVVSFCCRPWHVCHRAGFLACIMRVVPTSTFVYLFHLFTFISHVMSSTSLLFIMSCLRAFSLVYHLLSLCHLFISVSCLLSYASPVCVSSPVLVSSPALLSSLHACRVFFLCSRREPCSACRVCYWRGYCADTYFLSQSI